MRDINKLKRAILQRLSPAEVFSDLDPCEDAGKFVCTCPRCADQTLIAERGSDRARCTGPKCVYTTTFWDYIKQKEALDDESTLGRLAEMAGVALGGQKTLTDVYRIYFKAGQTFLISDDDRAVRARAFLQERGLAVDAIITFGFCIHAGEADLVHLAKKHQVPEILLTKSGLADIIPVQNKLFLPLKDEASKITGFVFFPMETDEKASDDFYLHNFSKGSHMFSVFMAHQGIKKTATVLIVNNALEVCRLHALGFNNAVSMDGDTVLEIHTEYFLKFGVKEVLMCKNGPMNCIKNSAVNLFKRGINVSRVLLPDSMDVIGYVKEYCEGDSNRMIWKTEPIWKWTGYEIGRNLKAGFQNITENSLKDKAMEKAEDIVSLLKESEYLEDFLYGLSSATGLSVSDFQKEYDPADGSGELEKDLQSLMKDFVKEINRYLNDYRVDIVLDRATQVLYGCPFPKNKEGSMYKEFVRAVIERAKKLDYKGIWNLVHSFDNDERTGVAIGVKRY